MYIQFQKTAEAGGKAVRKAKLLDYSGRCERPFDLPLREKLLWNTARYADLHGEFPDGEALFGRRRGRYGPGSFRPDDRDSEEVFPPVDVSTIWRNGAESGEALLVQAELERVRLACGKCHWCANQRKRRWERAATGWIENSPLTLFGTLTFSDEYFRAQWSAMIDAQLALGVEREGWQGFDRAAWETFWNAQRTEHYDPSNGEHDVFMRKHLMAERQRMLRRLRHALEDDAALEGIKLSAHLSVFEYGDLRGRLHMHFLMHVEIGQVPVGAAYSRLRLFLKRNWHGHGIGFVDVQHATPEGGSDAAKYLLQYLLKYEEVQNQKRVTKSRCRLAVSFGYRVKGTDYYFAARPPIIPGGSLRPVDPIPAEAREGFPASSAGDVDREDLYLSEASQKLSFGEMPHEFRVLAEQLAVAQLAWRDGEMWPGWSAGRERPEDDWAEVPPDAVDFAQWLLSRAWKDDRRFSPTGADLARPPWEDEAGGGAGPPPADVGEVDRGASYHLEPDKVLRSAGRLVRNSDGSVYDAGTGEVVEDDDPPF